MKDIVTGLMLLVVLIVAFPLSGCNSFAPRPNAVGTSITYNAEEGLKLYNPKESTIGRLSVTDPQTGVILELEEYQSVVNVEAAEASRMNTRLMELLVARLLGTVPAEPE